MATGIPNDTSGNTGNAFAAFLLGYASGAGYETPRDVRQIYKYYGGFVQDDFKMTSNLTLNLGLRYEYTTPLQGGAYTGLKSWEDLTTGKVDGFYNFDPTAPNPGAGGRLGAMVFSGEGAGRMTGTLFDGYPYAIAPRIGLAYRTVGHTVIRMYGGRTFTAVKTTGGSTHFEGFIVNRTQNTSDNSVNRLPGDSRKRPADLSHAAEHRSLSLEQQRRPLLAAQRRRPPVGVLDLEPRHPKATRFVDGIHRRLHRYQGHVPVVRPDPLQSDRVQVPDAVRKGRC